jgi:hypothetical protein
MGMRFFVYFCGLVLGPLIASSGHAADSIALVSARRALADGLPQIAALKAVRQLQLLKPRANHKEERSALAAVAVEGYVRSGEGEAAWKLLQKEPLPRADYWKAYARLLMGDAEGAEKRLNQCLQLQPQAVDERLLLAQVSLVLMNAAQAQEALKPILDGPLAATAEVRLKAERLFLQADLISGHSVRVVNRLESAESLQLSSLEGQLLLAEALIEQKRYADVERVLLQVMQSQRGGESVQETAALLLAESQNRAGRRQEAITTLIDYLEPNAVLREASPAHVFDLIYRCLESDPKRLPPDAVFRWLSLPQVDEQKRPAQALHGKQFHGYALLLMARWLVLQNRRYEALGFLETQLQFYPQHPARREALQLALETYSDLQEDGRVNVLAQNWRSEFASVGSALVEFVTGRSAFSRGDYEKALKLFRVAADLAPQLAERRSALFNAGVSALKAGESVVYQSLLAQLQAMPDGAVAADLELERLLDLAAKEPAAAISPLKVFRAKQPASNPRRFELELTLAEVLLQQVPTDFTAVEELLRSAESLPLLTDGQRLQLLKTELWKLDQQGELLRLAQLGSAFLSQQQKGGVSVDFIRMKVADAYYRLENFAAARTEFELVVKQTPPSLYADTALYFAGLSALSMMGDEGRQSALKMWEELIQRDSPLSFQAAQQQALALRLAGQEKEALKVMEVLLDKKKLNDEQRRLFICEKAETLILLGKKEPEAIEQAVVVLRRLLQEESLPSAWRARGGYTLARALSSQQLPTQALEVVYDVVTELGRLSRSTPEERVWYYRAGFFGMDLLEQASEWEAAAKLAETVAQASGDRAGEARERANKIRLEHFLWDGKPSAGAEGSGKK